MTQRGQHNLPTVKLKNRKYSPLGSYSQSLIVEIFWVANPKNWIRYSLQGKLLVASPDLQILCKGSLRKVVRQYVLFPAANFSILVPNARFRFFDSKTISLSLLCDIRRFYDPYLPCSFMYIIANSHPRHGRQCQSMKRLELSNIKGAPKFVLISEKIFNLPIYTMLCAIFRPQTMISVVEFRDFRHALRGPRLAEKHQQNIVAFVRLVRNWWDI